MTLSLFASHCLAFVALLLAGLQIKDHYIIEFPKLEQEVKEKFGADYVLKYVSLPPRVSQMNLKIFVTH
jgi:hypothetical protein|tara:strand:- start:100 stop:306 length:207 start_codon:yes stop_codon:yes gene_type:complete